MMKNIEHTKNPILELLRAPVIAALLLVQVLCLTSCKNSMDMIKGELKKWHPITVEFEGPITSETAIPNPFMDYRLNVTLKGPGGKVYTRPGYYAADGNAADTKASEGNKWQVVFTPDEEGTWTYVASFRTGKNVSISLDPDAGTPTSFDGKRGRFKVDPTDKNGLDLRGKGVLRYVGERYMRFDNGEYYLKGGAGSPEGLMGYREFDNTAADSYLFTPHAGDFDADDAGTYTWHNSQGKNILGMMNYLSDKGMNSIYIMSNALHGDTDHAWPWISTSADDRYRMDVSKLAQWNRVFSYMDKKGIMRHLFFGETENESLYEADEPATPLGGFADSRKLVYREFVARFGAGLAIVWNLGEETGQDFGGPYPQNEGLTVEQLKMFSDYIAALDDYTHVINVHEGNTRMKKGMLGHSTFTGAALYIGPGAAYSQVIEWNHESAANGVQWVVTNDEQTPWDTFNPPDWGDPDNPNYWHDDIRKNYLWGVLMAGGAGSDWYSGFKVDCGDTWCEDLRSRDHLWDMTRYANDFFHNYLPFWEMNPENELTTNGSDWVLAKPDEIYAVYMKNFEPNSINLDSVSGIFDVSWYDPRFGGPLQTGSVSSVTGGGIRSLGSPPDSIKDDCAILVVRKASKPASHT